MKQDKANIKKEIQKPTRSLTSDCLDKIGSEVMIQGWIAKIRNHGSLVFIDLRDWEGVIQLVLDKEKTDIPEKVGLEYVVEVLGTVVEREEGFKNEKMLTGNIEVQVSEITVLNESLTPPFPLDGNGFDVSEDIRYKYRYLDIRRKSVRDIIKNRHDLMMSTREWFSDNGFVEIQTPLLTVSSPEGARDYLVPSRIHQGNFYALPQAPQQYKQLLMVGGVDKYFQIAPCFRDEDPRADRHSGEFYQIDTECSFITRDELFHLSEPYFKEVVSKLTEKKIKQYRFPKIKYTEVIEKCIFLT
jgi:aspartyl-tRNA synthetase